jgi:hypothetical protein
MRGGVLVAAAVLLAAVLSVCLAPPVDAATASSVGTALPSIHSLFSLSLLPAVWLGIGCCLPYRVTVLQYIVVDQSAIYVRIFFN